MLPTLILERPDIALLLVLIPLVIVDASVDTSPPVCEYNETNTLDCNDVNLPVSAADTLKPDSDTPEKSWDKSDAELIPQFSGIVVNVAETENWYMVTGEE